MALTSCPECGHKVSTLAPACVGCGAPLGSAPNQSAEVVITTQQTAKKLKLHALGGRVLATCSGLAFVMNFMADNPDNGVHMWSILGLMAGAVWWVVAQVLIWWHHH
jgi:hypothetical protein